MTLASQLWPPVEPRTLTRQVWNAETAQSIPGLGRALGVYGMVAQCALMHVRRPARRGEVLEGPVPRMLQRPDPDMALPTWIDVHVKDWLLHGNATHLVTSYGADGYPASAKWYPAHAWGIQEDREDGQPIYTLNGKSVPRGRVVHVRRGSDPNFIHRGVGVVEQYLNTFNRAGLQSAAETANLTDRGMPAVAITKPNPEHDPENDDKVAEKWVERFRGPEPKPAIFPSGTEVKPLSWNPTDQQLVQARALTIKDIANATNLDGYWLGAEGSSHTYRSPGLMLLALMRVTLAPMLRTFEDDWSTAWLPYGRGVELDRLELLRDDLQTMVNTFARGRDAGLFPDINEPRVYMGFRELEESELPQVPPQLGEPPEDEPPAENPPADKPPEEETEEGSA